MSRTNKDSAGNRRRDIEVRLAGEGFDILRCGETVYAQIPERTLGEVLCIKWGYCGSEFDEILTEVRAVGCKTILF
ncbi:MAG TPA: hypothetical protein VGJ21_23100 [Terracidiphilus sp.]